MEEFTIIQLRLPADFSRKLDRHLIDLKEKGIKKTKEKRLIELAQIGYLNEGLLNSKIE